MRQLDARWGPDRSTVEVLRDGETLVSHPVEYSRRTHAWIKLGGNGKTQHGGIGVISSLRNGCFRALTGCGRCEERCYREEGDLLSGCYADVSTHAMIRWTKAGGSVIHNGHKPGTEGFFHVHLPRDGDYAIDGVKIVRVDSESASSCMSLALGLTQDWASANPGVVFAGISANHFRVPAEQLRRAA